MATRTLPRTGASPIDYKPLVSLFLRLLLAGLLTLGVIGTYLGYLQLSGNFSPVIAGEVYRSNQPTPARLRSYAEHQKIRSIINLRGRNEGRDWYDKEVATARDLGIVHIDFGISARKELTRAEAEQLIDLMRDAPKPLLIHCNAGADRSGLASALYLAALAGKSEAVAEQQLSLYFGHLPLPFIAEQAMDRTFEALEPWLGLTPPREANQPRFNPNSIATSIQPE
ncbi:tyrosine-protein phosphatase [Allorhizobium pseudoryzae]|uniref:tyrosine-protein phosphatase n=1 Tax=Allorhizobium pseudoryzae TaxID=379684 RepID=UPI003CFFB868